ncbi:MAG TPA: hypothetical protein VFR84_12740 [Candidatus Angelobacter sp.]|nr:hypothetical protein [Candidatus Angelobacter sp.]
MIKWLNRIGLILALVGGVVYVFAKIHFFTRFGAVSTDEYVKEHYPYTLGLLAIGGIIWVITRVISHLEGNQHKQE